MASSEVKGDAGSSCSGDWRDRRQGEDWGGDFGGGRGRGFRGYRSGGGWEGSDHDHRGEDRDNNSSGFRGYRGGGGRFNKRRGGFNGGNRRPIGLNPNASRFDDDLTPPAPKLDMTPVGNMSGIDAYWEEREKNRAAVKDEPFVFEPPETDFHLEASALLRELQEEREQWAVKDFRGNLIGDCRSAHGYDDVCQFCDGRRGKWAKSSSTKIDPAFRRYQDSIIASMPTASSMGLPSNAKLNTLQLAPFEDPEVVAADFEEMTLGTVVDEKITDVL